MISGATKTPAPTQTYSIVVPKKSRHLPIEVCAGGPSVEQSVSSVCPYARQHVIRVRMRDGRAGREVTVWSRRTSSLSHTTTDSFRTHSFLPSPLLPHCPPRHTSLHVLLPLMLTLPIEADPRPGPPSKHAHDLDLGVRFLGRKVAALSLAFLGPVLFVPGVTHEDLVHLLQSDALSLWHEEERPHAREHAEDTKEDERPVPRPTDEWRCNEADDEIVEPVRTGRERDALGSAG